MVRQGSAKPSVPSSNLGVTSKCKDSEQKCLESFLFCADFVNQYDKRESVIALPFPILASTFRLVGNDEIGLWALSVRRGAQGDTAAGIG